MKNPNSKAIVLNMANSLALESLALARARAGARYIAIGYKSNTAAAIDDEIYGRIHEYIFGVVAANHGDPSDFLAEVATGWGEVFSVGNVAKMMEKFPGAVDHVAKAANEIGAEFRGLVKRWIVSEIDFWRG